MSVVLSAQIEAKRGRRLATAPESCRRMLALAMAGKASPRMAIRAMCLECVGFERQAVRDCAGYACPLYEYRPYVPRPKLRPNAKGGFRKLKTGGSPQVESSTKEA